MTANTRPMVEIQNDDGYPIDPDSLAESVAAVLTVEAVTYAVSVSVVVTDDDSVQALNEQYRGVAAPTDVLSFPATPLPDQLADLVAESDDDDATHLGDLVIAYPYTSAQAVTHGHDLADMLKLLVVHGTLHLLGHDHDTPESHTRMWAAQGRALAIVGVPLNIVPSIEDEQDEHEVD